MVGAAMVILGVTYIVFRGQSANATPLAILRPADPAAPPPPAPVPRAPGPNDYLAIINDVNAQTGWGLDPLDVLTFIAVESSFKPAAYRYEIHKLDASYGLMQILFKTAQWLGYQGAPEGLYDPATNIYWGMRYIAHCRDYLRDKLRREPTVDELASAYNGGPGRVPSGWRSVDYVAKWKRARVGIVAA